MVVEAPGALRASRCEVKLSAKQASSSSSSVRARQVSVTRARSIEDVKSRTTKMPERVEEFDRGTLFLSGGGFKVVMFLGALRRLQQWPFKRFVGVSAGAFVACMLAAGHTPDELVTLVTEDAGWRTLMRQEISFHYTRPLLRRGAVQKLVGRFLELKGVPMGVSLAEFSDQRRPFRALALDVDGARLVGLDAMTAPGMRVVDAVAASMAAPGIVPAVRWKGHYYVDAAVVNNSPLSLCGDARDLFAIIMNPTAFTNRSNVMSLFFERCSFLSHATVWTHIRKSSVLIMPQPATDMLSGRPEVLKELLDLGERSLLMYTHRRLMLGMFVLLLTASFHDYLKDDGV